MRGHIVGQSARIGEIVEVRGAGGGVPFARDVNSAMENMPISHSRLYRVARLIRVRCRSYICRASGSQAATYEKSADSRCRVRSPTPSCFWRLRTPHSSPAPCCQSMAVSSPAAMELDTKEKGEAR